MRDQNGYIDICKLLNIPNMHYLNTAASFDNLYIILKRNPDVLVHKYYNGANLVFSFTYNNKTYFFNFDKKVDPLTNLIYEEICYDLGITALAYDLASLGNVRGNISQNYRQENAHYISGYDILKESGIHKSENTSDVLVPNYQNAKEGKILSKHNTLESIWAALEIRYKNRSNMMQIVQKLMDKLIEMFIVDIYVGNADRNYTNWEVVEYPNGEVDLAPIYDAGRSFLSDPSTVLLAMTTQTRTSFWPQDRLDDNIRSFLAISSKEYSNRLTDNIWVLSRENALKIISRIERKIGCLLPDETKDNIIEKFKKHYDTILGIINDYDEKIKR